MKQLYAALFLVFAQAAHGAEIDPQPFRPVLRGLLLTGEPRGGPALWYPHSKIIGRYLLPYLGGDTALADAAEGKDARSVELRL